MPSACPHGRTSPLRRKQALAQISHPISVCYRSESACARLQGAAVSTACLAQPLPAGLPSVLPLAGRAPFPPPGSASLMPRVKPSPCGPSFFACRQLALLLCLWVPLTGGSGATSHEFHCSSVQPFGTFQSNIMH